jgi:hypothetical protein
MRTE